ncbi:MAG: TlpA family protein disulfide reductase [Burkholderiales bacterium]|nr:TlpA family protein disulfide reductase [Burkholderiales bacterium]
MNPTLSIGPLALPWSVLVVFAAVALGWWLGERLGRRRGLAMEAALYTMLAGGLLGARALFVLVNQAAYLEAPWSILDVRDGGFSPVGALLGLVTATAVLVARQRVLAAPALAAAGGGAGLWLAGTLALSALAPPPAALPDLTLTSLDGQPVRLAALAGKPVVLNLWATWCPPCRREMPVLQQAQQRRTDVQFVFANQGEGPAQVSRFLAASRLDLRNVLLDARGEAGARLGLHALPATLLFDARGRLVASHVGALSPATLEELLARLGPAHPS